MSLQWCHMTRHVISKQRHLRCLCNSLYRLTKDIKTPYHWPFMEVDSPHKGPVLLKAFPYQNVTMTTEPQSIIDICNNFVWYDIFTIKTLTHEYNLYQNQTCNITYAYHLKTLLEKMDDFENYNNNNCCREFWRVLLNVHEHNSCDVSPIYHSVKIDIKDIGLSSNSLIILWHMSGTKVNDILTHWPLGNLNEILEM